MLDLFVYSWNIEEKEKTIIKAYALDKNNKNVCINITKFTPWIYVNLPNTDKNNILKIADIIKQVSIVKAIKIKKLKTLYYNNDENSSFLKVFYKTKRQAWNLINYLKYNTILINGSNIKLNTYDMSSSPILQMLSTKNINNTGWISIDNYKESTNKKTICDAELSVSWKNIYRSDNNMILYPKILSFDMEVYSDNSYKMPSNNPGDVIFQISCVIKQDKYEEKTIFTFDNDKNSIKNSDLLEDVNVILFDREPELIESFIDYINEQKPNIITGYNILQFDIDYLIKRSERLLLIDKLKMIGFCSDPKPEIEEIQWSSNAYSDQLFKFINWEGIILLDLLPIIKRDYKLNTYSLKNVSKTFLSDTKDPITHKDIIKAYKNKENLDIIAKYCVKDSYLCIQLLEKLSTWFNLVEMSKVFNVPIPTLLFKGQQIKVYSQIYKYCIDNNMLINDNDYISNENDIEYKGAEVFTPNPGEYENVIPLDFSSLYPSIIIANNICYSTIISNDKDIPSKYYNIFDISVHENCIHDTDKESNESIVKKLRNDISYLVEKKKNINRNTYDKSKFNTVKEEKDFIGDELKLKRCQVRKIIAQNGPINTKKEKIICSKNIIKFYKPEIRKGVIPTIIRNLIEKRKEVKQLMNNEKDEKRKIILNQEQLAYKISANSMYGAMGVKNGYLPFLEGAATITTIGRYLLNKTSSIISKHFKGTIIYGDTDSNYVIFPHINNTLELWNYAFEVANRVTLFEENGERVFKKPIKLEFEEKIFSKFIILAKKKYMYQEIDKYGEKIKNIGNKGVLLSRRDNSILIRNIYENIINIIFELDKNVKDYTYQIKKNIIKYLCKVLNDMKNNKINIDDYIITKSIKSFDNISEDKIGSYKIKRLKNETYAEEPTREDLIRNLPAHVILAEQMKNRGENVSPGTRLEYVVTTTYENRCEDTSTKLSFRLRHIDHFKELIKLPDDNKDKVVIDVLYYAKSFINPLNQLFCIYFNELIMNDIYKDFYNIYNEECITKKVGKINYKKYI